MTGLTSLKAKLLSGGLLVVLVMMLLTAVDLYSVNQNLSAMEQVYENQVVPSSALQEIDRDIKEIRFRMAAVLQDQMPQVGSRNHLKEARARISQQWALFKEKIAGEVPSDERKEQIEKIDKSLASTMPAILDQLETAYTESRKDHLAALLEDDWPAIHVGMVKPISILLPQQQEMVKQTYEKSQARGKRLISTGIAIFVGSLLLIVIFGWRIFAGINSGIRALKHGLSQIAEGNLHIAVDYHQKDEFGEMSRSLENTADSLKTIVEGVKGAADKAARSSVSLSHQLEQVIERGHETNESVMQIAAAMEEVSVANTEMAHSAKSASEAVHLNEQYAREGDNYMQKNRASMEQVVVTAHNSASMVEKLSDSIQKIGSITTVIRGIADQTNLLALNAAIEAARAGEQGRGFAVVADEVRKLAERTSSSTNEISSVVDSIKTETGAVVSSMSEVDREVEESAGYGRSTDEALKKIVEAANQATKLVKQIADGAQEQSTATEDVTKNMERISGLIEESATSVEQVGHAAEDVSHVAIELQQLVGKFKL